MDTTNGELGRIGAEATEQKVTVKGLRELLVKQKFQPDGTIECAITGRRVHRQDVALDHIVPLGKGGKHVMSNVRFVWKHANRIKHDMTDDELLQVAQDIVKKLKRQAIC